jgi:hypothetical protein
MVLTVLQVLKARLVPKVQLALKVPLVQMVLRVLQVLKARLVLKVLKAQLELKVLKVQLALKEPKELQDKKVEYLITFHLQQQIQTQVMVMFNIIMEL